MENVAVNLGDRSYHVLCGYGLLESLSEKISGLGFSGKCAVISDTNVAEHYLNGVVSQLEDAGFEPSSENPLSSH